MFRIFISHAGADTAIARRLSDDLRNTGHDVTVDLYNLKIGDNVIDFMNAALLAHLIIILYSQHTKHTVWQKLEVDAAIWQEAQTKACKVVLLRLDKTEVPPLLGTKVYADFDDNTYFDVLQRLLNELLSEDTDSVLFNRALAVNTQNPFWRVRAEYFADSFPGLLAEAFSPPEAAKMGILEEMRPCFLAGSRGTGKTMLLMSLRARTLASRPRATKTIQQLFGFYLRLERGAFCNAGITAANDGDFAMIDPILLRQLAETFSQELHLSLIESLLSELHFFVQSKRLSLSAADESALVAALHARMHGPSVSPPQTVGTFLNHCGELHRQLSDFIRRRFIYLESSITAPLTTLDTSVLSWFVATAKRFFPELSESQFTLLLDEYENLFPYQQIVANNLVKFGPPSFSVKIARKLGTHQTSRTTTGQELQEIHDYNLIPLIYSVENPNEFKQYLRLLESIVSNLLRSQGRKEASLSDMLPVDESPEVDLDELQREIMVLLRLSPTEFADLPERTKAERVTYYREAAIYRLIYRRKGTRAEKRYCGPQQLAFISSGVIRWFQEILGMSYHLEFELTESPLQVMLSPANQTRAVHIVANHNLSALDSNVETYGEELRYFLLDIGDCLRHKLLCHPSEPEGGRISISNPEQLKADKFRHLEELLRVGRREGVFQTITGRPGMRPKHGEPQPVEFNIARIYAPALQFSPRLRWKTSVICSELRGLLDSERRQTSKSRLMRKMARAPEDNEQGNMFTEEADDDASL